jgi:hypothetical protein
VYLVPGAGLVKVDMLLCPARQQPKMPGASSMQDVTLFCAELLKQYAIDCSSRAIWDARSLDIIQVTCASSWHMLSLHLNELARACTGYLSCFILEFPGQS